MPDQKLINILWKSQTFCARKKDGLHSVQLSFCAGTKVFEEALNAVKFLVWLKKFGPAQNILGPVKGQGIKFINSYKKFVKVSDEFVIRKYFTPLCS